MATKAKVIKINDLSVAIERAVAANSGKAKLPGGLIMGKTCTIAQAKNVDVNALAKSVTRDMSASLPGFKLTPKVVFGPDIIICGYYAKEIILG